MPAQAGAALSDEGAAAPGVGVAGDATAGTESAGSRAAGAPLALLRGVLRSAGQPLDAETRAYFEPRFGRDLSGVRVHTGSSSQESAALLNARAYSLGGDIVYGEGRRPGADALTAHELAHVAQGHSGSEASIVRRSDGFEDEPTSEWEWAPTRPGAGGRGAVESGGQVEWTEEASGEITEAEEIEEIAEVGEILEIVELLGPLGVAYLFIGFFGSIADAIAKLREESYLLGFCEGMAANLLGMPAEWVLAHLIEQPRASYPEVSVGGFKAARVGGNNDGIVAGYRFVQRLTSKQRIAFLKHGFAAVVARGGPSAMRPDRFDLGDVVTLAIALEPMVEALLQVAREQERARETAARRKASRGHGWAAW